MGDSHPMSELGALKAEVDAALSDPGCDNGVRRRLYTKAELLVMDYEEYLASNEAIQAFREEEEFKKAYTEVVDKLHLVPIKRPYRLWYWLDVIFRFIGVNCAIVTITIVCALPILLLQPVETMLGVDPFKRASVWIRQIMCSFILLCSGIVVDFGDVDPEFFKSQCALLCFSHSSNIDGFIVCSGTPIRHYAMGKKELFYVPFFSWISFAAGGVPVDRENKDRAIAALKRASEAAVNSKACIAIAPEGTRTKSGHLLDFKKGVFRIQEQLGTPIIPLVVYGAWDLYPVGSWVNQCGRVSARFLEPIVDTDGSGTKRTVEQMRRITRKKMLEALVNTPEGVCSDLSYGEWIRCYVVNLVNMLFVAFLSKLYVVDLFANYLKMDTRDTIVNTLLLLVGITVSLYVYSVYIINFVSGAAKSTVEVASKVVNSPGKRGMSNKVQKTKTS